MQLSKKIRSNIFRGIFGGSLFAWTVMLTNPSNWMDMAHCNGSMLALCSGSASGLSVQSLQLLLAEHPFSIQLLGWGVMVVAMMLPKLILPIQYIYVHSLKRFRFGLSCLFVLGYISIWMLVGVVMTAMILFFQLWLPLSYVPAMIVGLIAMIWQGSPIKQRFLNLGHDHWHLPIFGFPAFRAVFLFGTVHGIWCVGSGWALMLFPMLLPEGHYVAMLVVTFMMISEHLEHPKPLRWHFDLRLILLKYLWTQAKFWFLSAKVPFKPKSFKPFARLNERKLNEYDF